MVKSSLTFEQLMLLIYTNQLDSANDYFSWHGVNNIIYICTPTTMNQMPTDSFEKSNTFNLWRKEK